MKLGRLRDDYTKLTACEILRCIAVGTIGGGWLSKQNRDEAIVNAEKVTEEEADKILSKFDQDRQSAYNYWDMFN